MLFLKLKKTGPVVLSGDLYHYPEEVYAQSSTGGGLQQGADGGVARRLEDFLKKTAAQLWIEHDIIANAKLKKAPALMTNGGDTRLDNAYAAPFGVLRVLGISAILARRL